MADRVTPRVVREASMDWVKFDAWVARNGSIDPVDKALYAALGSFVPVDGRTTSDATEGANVPTREVLAACIGRSVDTVDRSTKRLEALGLVRVHRRRDPTNPKVHLPSVYELLDHEWWDERAARRVQNRRESAKKPTPAGGSDQKGGRTGAARGSRTGAARGSRTGAARGRSMDAATGGRMDAAHSSIRRGSKTPPSSPPSHTGPASTQSRVKDAPSAREEGRASHGNLNSLAESGEAVPPPRAAADDVETAPAADGNAFADELLKAAQRVLKDLPAPLTPGARTVRDLAPIVAAALADGWTPETLTARLTVDLPTTVRSARALLTHRLEDLPPPPLAEEPRPALPPHCGDARCRGGWLEDETGLPVGRCESWPHQTGPVLIHTARAPLG